MVKFTKAFTVIEIIVVIVILGILTVMGTVIIDSSQIPARDDERRTDVQSIANRLEAFYLVPSTIQGNGCAFGGNTTTYIGNGTNGNNGQIYCVNTFSSPGTYTVAVPALITQLSYLLIGGGGSGGHTGGGGAGGFLEGTTTVTPLQNYTLVVGAGGAARPASLAWITGITGGNTTFNGLIAYGGGGGGQHCGNNPSSQSGGSGGGGGEWSTACQLDSNGTSGWGNGAAGTAGQGNSGGNGYYCWSAVISGGGGGGAGGAGSNATGTCSGSGGNGGAGKSSSIIGSAVTYAGGGGGGVHANYNQARATGGSGGGGAGGIFNIFPGVDGENGKGSGGGGGTSYLTSGAGGSGVAIFKYTPTGTSIPTSSYPSTALFSGGESAIANVFSNADIKLFRAPNVSDAANSFVAATNNTTTTAGVLPQPTTSQYVYQPLQADGSLCTLAIQTCERFNIFYRLESDNTVYKFTGKNQ